MATFFKGQLAISWVPLINHAIPSTEIHPTQKRKSRCQTAEKRGENFIKSYMAVCGQGMGQKKAQCSKDLEENILTIAFTGNAQRLTALNWQPAQQ